MSELKDRIKEVRKGLTPKASQEKFAEMLGTTRNALKSYELGKVIPTDTFLQLLCMKFHISETWMRTGEGEMFSKDSPAPFETLAQELGISPDEKELLEVFLSFPHEERIKAIAFARQFAARLRELSQRNEAHRLLDQELDAQEKAQSASTFGSSDMTENEIDA